MLEWCKREVVFKDWIINDLRINIEVMEGKIELLFEEINKL